MSDKVDDALHVYTSMGYQMAEAHSVLAQKLNDLQDRIAELESYLDEEREKNEKQVRMTMDLQAEVERLNDWLDVKIKAAEINERIRESLATDNERLKREVDEREKLIVDNALLKEQVERLRAVYEAAKPAAHLYYVNNQRDLHSAMTNLSQALAAVQENSDE